MEINLSTSCVLEFQIGKNKSIKLAEQKKKGIHDLQPRNVHKASLMRII